MRTSTQGESSRGQFRDVLYPAVQDASEAARAWGPCPIEDEASRSAGWRRLGRTAEGLAVIHVTADDETGEVSALEVLARHGEIPEAFEEEIRAL